MPIKNVEFLEDGVRVHYNLGKPYGISDVHNATIDIPYSSINKLEQVPKEKLESRHFSHCEAVYIPKLKKTLVFVLDSYQENSVGPNEEDIHGPYLKNV